MNISMPSKPLALALAAALLAAGVVAGCADGPGNGGTTGNNTGNTTSGSTTGNTTSGSTGGNCTGPGSCSGSTIVGCPTGTTFHTLLASNGYVGSAGPVGVLCLVCSVTNPNNVVLDTATNNPAQLNATVSLLTMDAVTLQVLHGTTPTPPTFPAGTLAGFIVSDPLANLNVGLLQSLTVTTTLTTNGTTVDEDSAGNNKTVALDLLQLLGDPTKIAVAVPTTHAFSGLRLGLQGVANVLSVVDAWAAGVCE